MKKLRRLNICIVLALVLSLVAPASSGYAMTQKQKALNAYNKWLSKSKVYVVEPGSYGFSYYDTDSSGGIVLRQYTKAAPASKVKFALAYIDSDSIPELIIKTKLNCNLGNVEVWSILTYKNRKIKRIWYGCDVLGYYKKAGTFKWRDDQDLRIDHYWQINGTKIISKISKYYMGGWHYSVENNNKYSSNKHSVFSKYYKRMTKGKTLTKLTANSYHKNNSRNRKKYLR